MTGRGVVSPSPTSRSTPPTPIIQGPKIGRRQRKLGISWKTGWPVLSQCWPGAAAAAGQVGRWSGHLSPAPPDQPDGQLPPGHAGSKVHVDDLPGKQPAFHFCNSCRQLMIAFHAVPPPAPLSQKAHCSFSRICPPKLTFSKRNISLSIQN